MFAGGRENTNAGPFFNVEELFSLMNRSSISTAMAFAGFVDPKGRVLTGNTWVVQ